MLQYLINLCYNLLYETGGIFGWEGESVNRKKFPRLFSVVLLAFVTLLSAYLFMHSSIFAVTQVKVLGNEKVSQEEILALSGLAPGVNMFKFNEKEAARAIEVHPMIKQAEIKRRLFSEIDIHVTERQVWAVIPYNDIFLCIDDAGVCFDKLNYVPVDNDLIITLETVPDYVNLGQTVNLPATDMIKQVWQAIPADQHPLISEFYYQNDGTLKIYTLEGTEVRFGDLDRLNEKVETFSEVLQIESDLGARGSEQLDYVDIRFKGEPVLKTKE